ARARCSGRVARQYQIVNPISTRPSNARPAAISCRRWVDDASLTDPPVCIARPIARLRGAARLDITRRESPTTGRDVRSTRGMRDICASMLASFSNAAITVVVIAGLAGLAWFALRLDPHLVSKDGRRFTCKVQQIRQGGRIEGRWRDARCAVEG